ncbi:hypothetical protein SAMN04487910_0189 [Aquimarina amphilecti]|uniref:Polymer-forming protein n=1 Tax=Aquimarina amphilecti TaxID=1038014 RepID=A0A1H7FUY2_AQUAM|nr:hypothetical protein [Aquimarina amphilecti]SEK29759.1 hypothetical protein SAMN04487910_0189 [Aquimarina amphilecti]
MLKAGSLLYAIYVCLIIAILSGGLMYVFTINKTLATRQSVKEQLIDRCSSCFDYFLSNSTSLGKTNTEQVDLFNDGLICEFTKERWGMFSKLLGKTFFKKDTIYKNYIIGEVIDRDPIALYLCDFGEELKISGTTKIVGNVKLPKKRYKTVNILGNQHANNPKLEGSISISSQNLPKIISPKLEYPKNTVQITLAKLKENQPIHRGFDQPTGIVYLEKGETLDRLNIKGNFIFKSRDTIRVDNTSTIEDVIIQAPKIVLEEGFEGSLQIYADKGVDIESDVKLRYPSCIVIEASTRDYKKKINIAEDVKIYGGIVINGSSFREKQNNFVSIDENSLVVGDVYCNGIMELKGSIIGSLYTHKLQLETRSSKYADVILNGVIDATELPNNFVRLPLFGNTGENRLERIKNIQ